MFHDIPRTAPAEERLFKLYKRIDGRLHYREGWIGDHNAVTEHWGACGEVGARRAHRASASAARKKYDAIKAVARGMGFRPIPRSRHATLVVEIAIKGTRRACPSWVKKVFGDRVDLSRASRAGRVLRPTNRMVGPWSLRRWLKRLRLHGGVLPCSGFHSRENCSHGTITRFFLLRLHKNLPPATLRPFVQTAMQAATEVKPVAILHRASGFFPTDGSLWH
jgi:hypothetical protein